MFILGQKSCFLGPTTKLIFIIHTSSTGSGNCPDSSITIGTSCELWLSFKSGFGLVGAIDPPERRRKKSQLCMQLNQLKKNPLNHLVVKKNYGRTFTLPWFPRWFPRSFFGVGINIKLSSIETILIFLPFHINL